MRLFLISLLFLSGPALAACPALLDRKLDTLHDTPQSLCEYAGKVLLVVNTASQCGSPPQYEGLEEIYRKYRARGLVVLGFPSNDFGGQEPGSNQEIAAFCVNQYAIDFPMFAKTNLKANSFYSDLAKATGAAPRWNFHKYLVGRDGKLIGGYSASVAPDADVLLKEIEKSLATS